MAGHGEPGGGKYGARRVGVLLRSGTVTVYSDAGAAELRLRSDRDKRGGIFDCRAAVMIDMGLRVCSDAPFGLRVGPGRPSRTSTFGRR